MLQIEFILIRIQSNVHTFVHDSGPDKRPRRTIEQAAISKWLRDLLTGHLVADALHCVALAAVISN